MRNEQTLKSIVIGILSGIGAFIAALIAMTWIYRILDRRFMKELEEENYDEYEDDEDCNKRRYINKGTIDNTALDTFLNEMEIMIRKDMEEHVDKPDALYTDKIRLAATIVLKNPTLTTEELYDKLSEIVDSCDTPYDELIDEINKTATEIKEYILKNHKIDFIIK